MIEKEFRALLPLWLAAAAALLAAKQLGREYEFLAIPAYAIGAVSIGAWTIGHEYSYRTLPSLLASPVSRGRIWIAKLSAALPLLTALGVLAAWTLERLPGRAVAFPLFTLPVIAGLCIAPWLTMLSRTALGGTVFTLGLGGMLAILGEGVSQAQFTRGAAAAQFRIMYLLWSVCGVSAIAAAAAWRRFARLEATQGNADIQLDVRGAGSTPAAARMRRHPISALIRKELRLQQLAWAVAAVYSAIYVLSMVFGSDEAAGGAAVATVFFSLMLSIVIGALASAEERHLGTEEAQLLLPVSTATHWTVKVLTAFALTCMLGVLLPVTLKALLAHGKPSPFGEPALIEPQMLLVMAGLTSVSLYVSSVTGSGLRALMTSIPAVLAGAVLLLRVSIPVGFHVHRALWARAGGHPHGPLMSPELALPVGFAALFALVLTLAFGNYRWTDRSPVRIAAHIGSIAAATVTLFALLGAIGIY